MLDILERPRRLRRTEALRDLFQETWVRPDHLIYPLFFEENIQEPVPVESMPGIVRWPEQMIERAMHEAAEAGVRHVLLFGVSHHKDVVGSDSLRCDGLLGRMVFACKRAVPEMTIIADNCFCEYTSHGHCGPLGEYGVDNDLAVENLCTQALMCAKMGADVLAPSAMMDGQIGAMRTTLDQAGFSHVPLMAYASKMASACYGPFRAAAGCELQGDRKQYQMNPANMREALHEAALDDLEGADILMVKPGVFYLDVLTRLRDQTHKPLAAYQVSGEYAMIKFAAAAGAIDERRVVLESLLAFKRAGALGIISYFAPQAVRWLKEG